MTKRFKITLGICIFVFVTIAAMVCLPVLRQPSFKGKRIGAWITQAQDATRSGSGGKLREAQDAVKNIGEDAVPYLLASLRKEPLGLRDRLIDFCLQHLKFSNNMRNRLWALLIGVGSERSIAALLLGDVGPKAAPAVPELIDACQDSKQAVRTTAVIALGGIHSDPERCIPVLVKALNDKQWATMRLNAVWALKQFGPAAAKATNALIGALFDPDKEVQVSAAQALGVIDPQQHGSIATATLLGLLKDSDWRVKLGALIALGDLGPTAKAAVPTLQQLQTHSDKSVRGLATSALERIGKPRP